MLCAINYNSGACCVGMLLKSPDVSAKELFFERLEWLKNGRDSCCCQIVIYFMNFSLFFRGLEPVGRALIERFRRCK